MEIFPVYTSAASRNLGKGPGRAVHLGTMDRWTLCGTHKTHPHLLYDSGFPIEDLERMLRYDPDEVLCKRCKRIAEDLYNDSK